MKKLKILSKTSALFISILCVFSLFVACQPKQELGKGIHKFPSSDLKWREIQPGISIAIVTQGEGEVVAEGSPVQVHFTGWYEDQKMFDSSLKRDRAFRFKIAKGRVIAAWDKALVGLTKGTDFYLRSAPEFAFGDGLEDNVRANATVVFGMSLLP